MVYLCRAGHILGNKAWRTTLIPVHTSPSVNSLLQFLFSLLYPTFNSAQVNSLLLYGSGAILNPINIFFVFQCIDYFGKMQPTHHLCKLHWSLNAQPATIFHFQQICFVINTHSSVCFFFDEYKVWHCTEMIHCMC